MSGLVKWRNCLLTHVLLLNCYPVAWPLWLLCEQAAVLQVRGASLYADTRTASTSKPQGGLPRVQAQAACSPGTAGPETARTAARGRHPGGLTQLQGQKDGPAWSLDKLTARVWCVHVTVLVLIRNQTI